MALAMRMTRGGRRNRPFYRIVVADKRMPRDGRFIEKLGTYDPLIANDDKRVVLNAERIKFWLEQGAQPSPRVARFLAKAGLGPQPEISVTPQKSAPKAKAVERVKEKAEKKKAAEDAAKAAAAAPAPEAAPEAPAAEAPAADAPAAEEKTEG